jgi:hypothetical protein
MNNKISPLTQTELKEYLHYNPDTGVFTWKKSTSKRMKVGSVAGSHYSGTIGIVINKKPYRANRLAWLYMTGEWPACDLKPINGIPEDIRWSNIKMGTRKR